jgi:hypothetical protein
VAKGKASKLKVFQTRIGFHDYVVASPSRAAALRAWGTRRDLFAQGLAAVATDPEVVAAALAHPDTPLKRPAGSSQPFGVEPAQPKIAEVDPDGERQPAAERTKAARRRPDRRQLAAAEADLARIDADYQHGVRRINEKLQAIGIEEADLMKRRAALKQQEEEQRRDWKRRRSKAVKVVEQERQTYLRAGGKA